MYVGTDVGVWTTTDGGANWSPFSDGLPNVAVYDLKLHAPTRLLRAATHGRGLWERELDVAGVADVRIVIRDHVMDTGRLTPSPSGLPSAWEDPDRQVNLGDPLFWWNCADVKVNSPVGGTYQMPVAALSTISPSKRRSNTGIRNGARLIACTSRCTIEEFCPRATSS